MATPIKDESPFAPMPQPRPLSSSQAAELARALGDRLQRGVQLAPYTTLRIGGPAAYFVPARSAAELAGTIALARRLDIDHFLLGCGANILVGDRGYPGLIIHNRATQIGCDGTRLTADSGALMANVIDAAVERGLSGVEHYVGIPSTVGGALWQNLHFLSPPPERARTMFIAEVLAEARILSAQGEPRVVDAEYFRFGYDYSILHERADVVLTATFQLRCAPRAVLRRIMAANLDWRGQRHPPLDTEPSAGSIFRKIDGLGAGRLIDDCGLKGLTAGGAQISPRHANIIVNRGGASAADVCALILHAQQAVLARSGHWLTPEIGFVGAFAPVRRLPAPVT